MSLRPPGGGDIEPASPPQTVFVVDDDASTRELLAWLMKRNSIPCQTFAEPRSFLNVYRPELSGCLILDLHMPGMSGLDLQRKLKELNVPIPVIFVSGHADVPRAVEAVKGGAYDFIEKPFDYKRMLALVRECMARDLRLRAEHARKAAFATRVATLTAREREVMERVVAGHLNRVIAEELDISVKTVEAHRARIMEKLGAGSIAELVQAMLGHVAELDTQAPRVP